MNQQRMGTSMLALRSILVMDALDEGAMRAAAGTAADAVVIDLAHPSLHGQRADARRLAARHAATIAKTGRPVIVRVSDARSGQMDADIEAIISPSIAGILVSGVEEPQDVRDADVAVRKQEMRRHLGAGGIAILPEIDSAEGLVALPRILLAIDRVRAVVLSVDGLRSDLRLGTDAAPLFAHAMSEVAIQSDAARVPWVLHLAHHRPGIEQLPSLAHDLGALGVTVSQEGETRGMNSLFTPAVGETTVARAMVAEWDRVRKRGEVLGVVAGEHPEVPGYDRLVDRRTVRRARALLEVADAIARREAIG